MVRTFGADLAALDTQWRQFLAQIPVDMEQRLEARDNFDPELWPAYLDTCCPKVGERSWEPHDEAERRWYSWDWEGALRLYLALYEDSEKPRWAYEASQCLRKLHRLEEARDLLEQAGTSDDLTPSDQDRLLTARIAILLQAEDWSGLYTAWERRRALQDTPSPDRELLETCLRAPELRSPIARALSTDDTYLRRRLLEDLLEQHPDHEALQYVYATRALGEITDIRYVLGLGDVERNWVTRTLGFAAQSTLTADRLGPTLLQFSATAIRSRAYPLAQEIASTLLLHSDNPLLRYRARLLQERLDWEQRAADSAASR